MAQRNTVQLSVVDQALQQLANHPTADQVYQLVHESHPSISKATVYRTLNKLVGAGRAGKVLVAEGADRFDHRTCAHSHIRCKVCGRVDDVEVSLQGGAEQQARDSSGYLVEGYSLLFSGTCPACAHAATA